MTSGEIVTCGDLLCVVEGWDTNLTRNPRVRMIDDRGERQGIAGGGEVAWLVVLGEEEGSNRREFRVQLFHHCTVQR